MCVVFVCRGSLQLSERSSSDPSSPRALCRPLCSFKSCPSEPASSSCSIFIKPLSLKEPYPGHGKSHSSRSLSHALSILALICCCLRFSLTLSPPLPLSPPPPLSLSPLIHTFTYIHILTHSHTLRHAFTLSLLHAHTDTHMLTHTRPLAPSESDIPVQAWGQQCWRGSRAAVSLRVLCCHFGGEVGLSCSLFPLPLIPGMLTLD